jgi:hypothetical protein
MCGFKKISHLVNNEVDQIKKVQNVLNHAFRQGLCIQLGAKYLNARNSMDLMVRNGRSLNTTTKSTII